MLRPVLFLVSLCAWTIRALFLSRSALLAENLALRQQVCTLKRERPRPPLDDVDRAFWVALRAFWPGWASRLIIVDPGTVAKWARERFRDHWAKISQQTRPGTASNRSGDSTSHPVDPENRSLLILLHIPR